MFDSLNSHYMNACSNPQGAVIERMLYICVRVLGSQGSWFAVGFHESGAFRLALSNWCIALPWVPIV